MNDRKTTIHDDIIVDEVRVTRLENDFLTVDVSPETGGRITSIFNKLLQTEFLWKNERLSLRRSQPGDPYDPNFYGGIDEVIPGDMPERIQALENPDHGELWTLPLMHHINDEILLLYGILPRWGMRYQKRVALRLGAPWIDIEYKIENRSNERRIFLWKLHAALVIGPGDRITCPARTARIADPQWSRWNVEAPFAWPTLQGEQVDRIPPANGTTDFLFLYNLESGQVSLQRPDQGIQFSINFDPDVFPYVCYFASYGGFDNHYTAVLEPSTAMPVSVNDAMLQNQCSFLESGAKLETRISIFAGPWSE